MVRFEAVAGEFSQHDFGTVTVEYTDGVREAVHFFASRLMYSRLIRVRLVPDERTETLCHGLVDAFGYFGGMPLLAVFDNPKTIVQTRRGSEVVWQVSTAVENRGIPAVWFSGLGLVLRN